MKEFLKDFANNIKTIRTALGLSQEKFAEKIDISKNRIIEIERGRSFVKLDTLEAICKTFNLTLEDLFCPKEENELISAIILGAKTLTPQQQKQLIEIIKTFKA